jgi:hypothetical protein
MKDTPSPRGTEKDYGLYKAQAKRKDIDDTFQPDQNGFQLFQGALTREAKFEE